MLKKRITMCYPSRKVLLILHLVENKAHGNCFLFFFFFCCVSNNRLGTSALFLHPGCKAGAALELELVHVADVMKQLVRGFFQDTLEYKTINQVTDRVGK